MNRIPLIMNPEPPTICGAQKAPFRALWDLDRVLFMLGRAVKPDIQKIVAPSSWKRQARKPISFM